MKNIIKNLGDGDLFLGVIVLCAIALELIFLTAILFTAIIISLT